jgi:hypothetical protein
VFARHRSNCLNNDDYAESDSRIIVELMAYIHLFESGRWFTMRSYWMLFMFIVMNSLAMAKLKSDGIIVSNMTCVNIPMASLSSANDDRFTQLKLFSSPQFVSNSSLPCRKFDM